MKDDGDLAASYLVHLAGPYLEQVTPLEQHSTAGDLARRLGNQSQHSHRADTLATTTLPHQTQGVPLLHAVRDAVHGLNLAVFGVEANLQVLNLQ